MKYIFTIQLLVLLIIKTNAQTWAVQTQTNGVWTNYKSDVHFISPTVGWMAGYGGDHMLYTTNGGTEWNAQAIPTTTTPSSGSLNSVFFISATKGWATGLGNTIITTNNSGTTWTLQNSPYSTAAFNKIFFINPTKGWIVGYSAKILTTNDGGLNWTIQNNFDTPGFNSNLFNVQFVSTTKGWACGCSGKIITTNDGGNTWTTQYSAPSSCINSIHFITPLQGWAAGTSGVVLTTVDGGTTWTSQNTGITGTIRTIHFVSSTFGWIGGDFNGIYTTIDGGLSWTLQSTIISNVNDIFFISPNKGWAVGGNIVSFDNTIGVKEIYDDKNILVYPNPSNNNLKINGKNLINVVIENELGQMLMTKALNDSDNNDINISELKRGTYYIKLMDINKRQITKKIVKQ